MSEVVLGIFKRKKEKEYKLDPTTTVAMLAPVMNEIRELKREIQYLKKRVKALEEQYRRLFKVK